ncbi:M23 family metallopeptidase [Sutcliffiella horikoshii]|uniref:M23 family metallopeptidase n=1 Tax=Sutcliffiella horikoshii TaxID=79883 RepID=A0A5D4SQS5_9BACI|nr:M23 family metallopeptidase [Sutcliffiella horikoshii]TYS64482.1 M23 family metallopeptidase [Sutcliffiella horikoshii]
MKFRISSKFGIMEEIRDGKPHTGIDFAMPEGTDLRAIGDAVVERVVNYGSENIGKGVILKLEDGTRAIYGHMDSISVKEGAVIKAGDLLGASGNTGHSSGAHLHFGLWKDGEYIDPTPIAEQVADLSGSLAPKALSIFEPTGAITQWLFGKTVTKTTKETAYGILEGLCEVLVELSGAIALVGGGICLLLHVGGWKGGIRWMGILTVARILILMTLGGV